MELIGSLLLIVAVALVVAIFVSQPFLRRQAGGAKSKETTAEWRSKTLGLDHQRSTLLAERDQVLAALQELDFDNAMGKVPEEDYREQRASLLKKGTDVLRHLDEMGVSDLAPAGAALDPSVEDRIEAAVAARRADSRRGEATEPAIAAVAVMSSDGNGSSRDSLEELIAARKRVRKESAAGFCPRCGRPVQKSDKFCSRCGSDL